MRIFDVSMHENIQLSCRWFWDAKVARVTEASCSRHHWNGSFFRLTGPLCGKITGHWWISLTKGLQGILWCRLDVGLHKLLNRWFETIWRYCDVIAMVIIRHQNEVSWHIHTSANWAIISGGLFGTKPVNHQCSLVFYLRTSKNCWHLKHKTFLPG